MKKIFAFLLCAVTFANIAGCSDDEDESILTSPDALVGKWECYKDYDGEFDVWDYDYGEGIDLYLYEFRADGTGAYRLDDYMDVWIQFTYKLSGNMLSIVNEKAVSYTHLKKVERAN